MFGLGRMYTQYPCSLGSVAIYCLFVSLNNTVLLYAVLCGRFAALSESRNRARSYLTAGLFNAGLAPPRGLVLTAHQAREPLACTLAEQGPLKYNMSGANRFSTPRGAGTPVLC